MNPDPDLADVELEPIRPKDLPLGAVCWLAFTVIMGCATVLWWTFGQ